MNNDQIQASKDVVAALNVVRKRNGLPEAEPSVLLTVLAQEWADYMAGKEYLGHGAGKLSLDDRMKAFGLSNLAAGECVARGVALPSLAVNLWANDRAHLSIMLGDYSGHPWVGGASADSADGVRYWCMVVAGAW